MNSRIGATHIGGWVLGDTGSGGTLTINQHQHGTASIQNETTKTQTGTAFIVTYVSTTPISSMLAVGGLGAFTLGGITFTGGPTTRQEQFGTADIQVTTTKTQTGTAAIGFETTQTQDGTALLFGVTTQTQTGTAQIYSVSFIRNTQSTLHVLTEGSTVADIRNTQSTLHVLVEYWQVSNRTQTGTADIQKTIDKTQTGHATIGFLGTHTQTGHAIIKATVDKTQTGTAFLFGRTTKNQTGIAAVQGNNQQAQNGTALIVQFETFTDGDTLALGITDASAITTGTIGSSSTADTLALGITDASTLTTWVVVDTPGSDTLTIGIIDDVPHIPIPTGLRADQLSLGITDASSVAVSGTAGVVPLISPPVIKIAPQRAHNHFDTYNGSDSNAAVKLISDTLQDAGWTLTTPIYASMSISMANIPTNTFVSPSPRLGFTDDWLNVDGILYWFYTPLVDTITPYPNVSWVVKGFTDGTPTGDAHAHKDSVDNLAAAINASTTFSVTIATDYSTITLVSRLPGIDGNNHYSGLSFGFPSTSIGGGYELTSSGAGGQTQMVCQVSLDANNSVCIIVKQGTNYLTPFGSSGFNLGQYTWQLWANPYQFLLSPKTDADVPYHGGDVYVFNSSLFVCSPWISPNAAVTSCAYGLIGYVACRESLQENGSVLAVIDGTYYDGSGSTIQGYAMLCWNQDSTLQVWNDSDPTCYQDAIVMLSRGLQNYKCVGYVWDAFMTTEDGTDAPRGRAGTINYYGTLYNTVVMANTGASVATMYLLTP